MKVLFLYVNTYDYTGIPMGLSYLISVLKRRQHQVSLFDTTFLKCNYNKYNISRTIDAGGTYIIKSFQDRIDEFKPDVIAVSVTSSCFPFSVKMLEMANLHRAKVIYGGIHATVDSADVFSHSIVDYVCRGYGEETLPMLLTSMDGDLSTIPNLVWRGKDRSLIYNSFKLPNLPSLPMPDWGLFDERHLVRPFKDRYYRWGNFQLTRGCPFSCRYCCNNFLNRIGGKVQHLSANHVIDTIECYAQKYKLDIIKVFDETFGMGNMKEVERFAEEYARRIGLPSIIETNPLAVNEKLISILKKINCIAVSLGIECGDEGKRKVVCGRNISDERIISAFQMLRDNNIRTSSYNILNWMGDTRGDIFKLIDLNRKCLPEYINTFFFTPLPGTELWDDCQKAGVFKHNCVVDFVEKPNIKNPDLTEDEIIGLRRTFPMYVYFKPELWPLIHLGEAGGETGQKVLECLAEIPPTQINEVDISDRLKVGGISVEDYNKWRGDKE